MLGRVFVGAIDCQIVVWESGDNSFEPPPPPDTLAPLTARPLLSRASAMALPSPLEAPVTKATLCSILQRDLPETKQTVSGWTVAEGT